MVRKYLTRCLTLLLMAASVGGALAEVPDVISSDEDLLATNEATAFIHTVTFMDAWGAVLFEERVNQNQTIKPPVIEPERDGYDFLYWYDLAPSTLSPFQFEQAVDKDLVLWPYFERSSGPSEVRVDQSEPAREAEEQERGSPEAEPDVEPFAGEDIPILTDSAMVPEIREARDTPMIRVTSSLEEVVEDGGRITLIAELIGFSKDDVHLQWQYAAAETPNEWIDVPGATSVVYAFGATEETVGRLWRLMATMK